MADDRDKCMEALVEVMKTFFPKFEFTFILVDHDTTPNTMLYGNCCPKCSYEAFGEWIKVANVQHNALHHGQTNPEIVH